MKDPWHHEPHSHTLPEEEVIRFRVKAELRKRMRGLRKTTPESACAVRSSKIVAHLLAHEWVRDAASVALFFPIEERHEVDLRPLDNELRSRRVKVAYPSIDQETNAMLFRKVDDLEKLEEQGLGFREPSAEAEVLEPDLVIVPALAIAPSGHRLGYGRGYYDRALRALREKAKMFHSIAVAYDFQFLVEIPNTEGDFAVDWLVTDARSLPREG